MGVAAPPPYLVRPTVKIILIEKKLFQLLEWAEFSALRYNAHSLPGGKKFPYLSLYLSTKNSKTPCSETTIEIK